MTSVAGLYGTYGGRYVPETLVPALDELEAGWRAASADPAFRAETMAAEIAKVYRLLLSARAGAGKTATAESA